MSALSHGGVAAPSQLPYFLPSPPYQLPTEAWAINNFDEHKYAKMI